MKCPVDWVTDNGFDMQFGCNVIGALRARVIRYDQFCDRFLYAGHHFFTQLLLPALLSATASSGEKARVVTVSSSAAYIGSIDFDTLIDGHKRRKMQSEGLYCQSKLVSCFQKSHESELSCPLQGNALVSREFARKYGDKLVSTSLNPGNIDTGLYQHFHWFQSWVLVRVYPNLYRLHLNRLSADYAELATSTYGSYYTVICWYGTRNC